MADEMVIRPARAEDAEQIHEIEVLCFAQPWSLESILGELTDNPQTVYAAAEIDGQIVGYAGIWQILDEGHITNVAVRPGFRERGIGAAVLEALIGYAAARGIRHYTLEVNSENGPAIRLYEKHGFSPEGIRKQYYKKENGDALIMWRHDDTETEA